MNKFFQIHIKLADGKTYGDIVELTHEQYLDIIRHLLPQMIYTGLIKSSDVYKVNI